MPSPTSLQFLRRIALMGAFPLVMGSCGGIYTAYTADGVYYRPVANEPVAAQRSAAENPRQAVSSTPTDEFDYYDPNAEVDFRPWEVPSNYNAPGFSNMGYSNWGYSNMGYSNMGFGTFGMGYGSYGGYGGYGPSWGYDPFNPWGNPYSGFGWNSPWGMPAYGGGFGYPYGGYYPYGGSSPYGGYYPGIWPGWGGNDGYRPIGQPTSLPRPNRGGISPNGTPPPNGRYQRTLPQPERAPDQKPSERGRWMRDVEQFFERNTPESPSRPSRSGEPGVQTPSRPSRGESTTPSRPSPSPSGGGGRSGGSPQAPNSRTR